MRKALAVSILLAAAPASEARAFDIDKLYDQALSAARSLVPPGRHDRDIIPAPRDLDRKMALVPPHDRSHMPVIAPRR